MDRFKIEHFQRDNPGCVFPAFSTLGAAETRALRERLKAQCGLPGNASDLELTRSIALTATTLPHADPQEPDFDVADLLRQLNINPGKEVFINWHRFDIVDRMQFNDLVSHFSDIWYPGADDIELFDDSCSWVLVVPHSGTASLAIVAVDA
jgi:hypothetical protein